MPEINGRYYANPAYGRAVERARIGKTQASGHRHSHPRHYGTDDYDAATTPAGVANQIYNESAGLRPTDKTGNGAGSDFDLQQAREAMAHVIQNRAARKIRGGLGSPNIGSPADLRDMSKFGSKAYDAHGAAVYAAHHASKHPDPTEGAMHFYLDDGTHPQRGADKGAVAAFGPFRNVAGGGDVRRGKNVKILILP